MPPDTLVVMVAAAVVVAVVLVMLAVLAVLVLVLTIGVVAVAAVAATILSVLALALDIDCVAAAAAAAASECGIILAVGGGLGIVAGLMPLHAHARPGIVLLPGSRHRCDTHHLQQLLVRACRAGWPALRISHGACYHYASRSPSKLQHSVSL